MVMIPDSARYLESASDWADYVEYLRRDRIYPHSAPKSFPCYVKQLRVLNPEVGSFYEAIVQIWHVAK